MDKTKCFYLWQLYLIMNDKIHHPVLPEKYSLKFHYCDLYSKMVDKNIFFVFTAWQQLL